MSDMRLLLLTVFVAGFLLGGGSLFLVHCRCRRLARCGRWLFVLVLSGLGVAGLIAAQVRVDALAPLGLLTGLLTTAMLWEPAQPELEATPHS